MQPAIMLVSIATAIRLPYCFITVVVRSWTDHTVTVPFAHLQLLHATGTHHCTLMTYCTAIACLAYTVLPGSSGVACSYGFSLKLVSFRNVKLTRVTTGFESLRLVA